MLGGSKVGGLLRKKPGAGRRGLAVGVKKTATGKPGDIQPSKEGYR
jgi:hypothetical protein